MKAISARALVCLLLLGGAAGTCDHGGAIRTERQAETGNQHNHNAGGGFPARYQGVHQREVHHLLSRASGWRTSGNVQTDGGVPPQVLIEPTCTRDTHVAAAVQYAWAAESFYRLDDSMAVPMATRMRNELNKADRFCTVTGSEDLRSCRTLFVWACPPIR